MMLPTAAAMTTRRSSFSEILGAGISPLPFLGVSRESLREPFAVPSPVAELRPCKAPSFLAPVMPTTLFTLLIPRHLTEGINECQAYLNDWLTYFGVDF